MRTAIEVALFFQPKGIHRHGGATTIRGAALDASARSVVDGEVLALRASVLLDKVIEQVIGECRGGAAVGAGSDVYTQPQRNKCRLHGLLDHCHQILPQLIQVNFMAQCCTKSGQGACCIILAPIEAAVDDCLNTSSQGLEHGGNDQRLVLQSHITASS